MAAANTDKLRKKKSLFQTTLNGAISDSDTTLTLNSASGLPTDTAVTIVINRVDANGTATPSAMEVLTGVVSGSTITNLLRAKDSTTAKSHANASVVEMVWDADTWNDFVDAYLSEHGQDGLHLPAAISVPSHAATSKATPVDADEIPIVDSAASNVLKKLTWANLKATLKTYFDTLYAAVTGFTMSGNITLGENTSIDHDPVLSADGKYTGLCITGTAGAALAFGDLIYLDPTDSRWELVDANAAAAADGDARGILGMCVLAATGDGEATKILLNGVVRADTAFPTLTINAPAYVSETAGDIVVAQPTTTDAVIRIVGIAITADALYFNPSNDHIIHI